MLKKMMLMATMVAAVASFAAPSAQATFANSNWSMGGVELTEAGTIEGTGQLKFTATSGLGGIECHAIVHANLTAKSSTGAIDKFIVSNCMNFGFLLTVCGTNVDVTPTVGTGWVIHAQKTEAKRRILITETRTDITFTEETASCPSHEINIEGSNAANPVFAEPDSPTAATKLTLGGEVNTGLGASKAEGTLTLFNNAGETKGNSGTYGIL